MVHEIHEPKLNKKLRNLARSPFFIPGILLFFLVLTIPIISLVTSHRQDIRQRAAAGTPTATMIVNPSIGSYVVGQTFSMEVVIDGGGQSFNASQADITFSSNLTVQSLIINDVASGGCNFTYVNTRKTPTVSSPSFAGAILNGSSTHCKVFSVVILANSAGSGSIALSKTAVKSALNHNDILSTVQNGSYSISVSVSPTSTPTPTSLPPTSTPTPTPSVIPTPTPTSLPTPTPISVAPPTIDAQSPDTYHSSVNIGGTKPISVTQVFVNSSSSGVSYPTSSSWQYPAVLVLGANNFNIYGIDSSGSKSSIVSTTINLHRLGDISGDNVIDLIDLSIFGSDWEKTSLFNNPLSDMNDDGIVDLTDFSILASAYGN